MRNLLTILIAFITLQTSSASTPLIFIDKTEESGLHKFEHRLGHKDKKWIIGAMGSGVAVADYDNDDDDDIYFVNGQSFDDSSITYQNALFQNNNGTFTNVTNLSGVGDTGIGMCAAFGDINNDGWLDLFIGNYGPNKLYLNNQDGTFKDYTSESGFNHNGYAAAASFADIDRDGDLDLYLGNYVDFEKDKHGAQRALYKNREVFLGPLSIPAQYDCLYINNGKGRFTNKAASYFLNPSKARAMGSAFFDIMNDGWLDLYIANDSTYNHILQSNSGQRFEDLSYASGGGFSDDGRGGASMGVSAGDYNNDGFFDVYVTSYENESDLLYRNNGNGTFFEASAMMGLFAESLDQVTWGSGFADFDSDGWLDLYTVNGHVYPQVDQTNSNTRYKQGISLYHHNGKRYEPVPQTQINTHRHFSGRGSALLDYDNDGDMDIIINCIDDRPLLLENQTPQGNWLKLKLQGLSALTYGVRVVARKDDKQWSRMVDGGSGYLSQNSQALHFGLGDANEIDSLTIHWHHRSSQTINNPEINSTLTIQTLSD